MRRTKLLRVLPALDYGGVESRISLQAQLVDRDRFDLRVATFHHFGAAARAVEGVGIPVDSLGVDPAIRNPRATLALSRYLRRHRPDIIHASISEGIFHAALASRVLPSAKLVLEEVGVPDRSEIASDVFGLLYRRADQIVAVAEVTKGILLDEGAPPSRLEVVYNCAAPRFFPDRPRRHDHHGPLKVLVVGRLVSVKNQRTALAAFARLAKTHPQAQMSVAGAGPLEQELQQFTNALGIADRVTFLGFRDDVDELMQRHHLFLLPSHSEGCSISLIEAMATGINVLGSTADGIVELLGALGDEYIVPTTDESAWFEAMRIIADASPIERRRRANRSQQRAYTHFSPTAYMSRLTDLYDRMTRGANS